jgi:hypothetical protein
MDAIANSATDNTLVCARFSTQEPANHGRDWIAWRASAVGLRFPVRFVAEDFAIARCVLNPGHFTPLQNLAHDFDGSQFLTVVPAPTLSALDAGLPVANVKITTTNACHLTSHRFSSRVAEVSDTGFLLTNSVLSAT